MVFICVIVPLRIGIDEAKTRKRGRRKKKVVKKKSVVLSVGKITVRPKKKKEMRIVACKRDAYLAGISLR